MREKRESERESGPNITGQNTLPDFQGSSSNYICPCCYCRPTVKYRRRERSEAKEKVPSHQATPTLGYGNRCVQSVNPVLLPGVVKGRGKGFCNMRDRNPQTWLTCEDLR